MVKEECHTYTQHNDVGGPEGQRALQVLLLPFWWMLGSYHHHVLQQAIVTHMYILI